AKTAAHASARRVDGIGDDVPHSRTRSALGARRPDMSLPIRRRAMRVAMASCTRGDRSARVPAPTTATATASSAQRMRLTESRAGSDGSRRASRRAAEERRPFESRLAMVGGSQIVVPRDHFEKRHPRGVAYTDDVIPLLLGAADEDELLLAHPQN